MVEKVTINQFLTNVSPTNEATRYGSIAQLFLDILAANVLLPVDQPSSKTEVEIILRIVPYPLSSLEQRPHRTITFSRLPTQLDHTSQPAISVCVFPHFFCHQNLIRQPPL